MTGKKTTRGEFHYLTKTIAVIVCLCMVLTDIAYAAPLASAANPPYHESAQPITIPEELGTIDESHQGTSGKTIIYIQDAHDSLEAQENIAKIIHYLVEHNGVKTVFEEGYEGPVPSDEYFGFIEDAQIKERVSYFLLDKLRIGGAEYAHINRKQDFDLIGADNIDLHLENIEWYRGSAERRDEIAQDLKEIEKHLKKLANKYFPKEMKEWMKLKRRLDEDKLPLLDYVKRTMVLRTTAEGVANNAYPNINLLLSAENSNDPKVAEQTKRIQAKALFKEIQQLENDLANSSLDHDRDQKVFQYYKGIQLLKRLNTIEITSEEYEAVKDTLTALNTDELAAFIAKHTRRSLVLSKRWESNIRHAMKFYELAEARDEIIRKNMEMFDERNAVLVFGGFHKDNIKSILKDNGFSYHIITPKITETSEIHQQRYIDLMKLGQDRFQVSPMLLQASRALSNFVGARINPSFRPSFQSLIGEAIDSANEIPDDVNTPQANAQMTLNWNRKPEEVVPDLTKSRSEARNDHDDYPVLVEEFPGFLRQVLEQYDLGQYESHGKVAGSYKNRGYWVKTSKGEYFVKWNRAYADRIAEMSAFEMKINHFVNQRAGDYGYAWRIPRLHAARNGAAFTQIQDQAVMIYDYLPGTFTGWGEQRGKKLKPGMEMMAEVHKVLSEYPDDIPNYVRTSINAYHELPKRIQAFRQLRDRLLAISSAERKKAAKQVLEEIDAFIHTLEVLERKFPPASYETLAKQLVHLDFAPIHLMYEGSVVKWIIDWENADHGTVAVDFVKGMAPFHEFTEYDEFIDSVAHYQNHANQIGNSLDADTLNAIPFIHVLHRLKLASALLNEDYKDDINIDWPLLQLKTVTQYGENDFQEFDNFDQQVEGRRAKLDAIAQREIRRKTESSGNVLNRLTKSKISASNSDDSPITVTKYRTLKIRTTLNEGDYNGISLKIRGRPLDIDGYGEMRMKLKVNSLELDRTIVNQEAAFKVQFKQNGQDVYVTRTSDMEEGVVVVKIPPDLDTIDGMTFIFEHNQSIIREADIEIEEIEFFLPLSEKRTAFNLSTYTPYPRNPRHVIVDMDQEFVGSAGKVLSEVEQLIDRVGAENNFELYSNESLLTHGGVSINQYSGDQEAFRQFILGADELIVTGGYCADGCHGINFQKILRVLGEAKQGMIFHFPRNAIFAAAGGDLDVLSREGFENSFYHLTLKVAGRTYAVYMDGEASPFKNSDRPQFILNIWETLPDWTQKADAARSEARSVESAQGEDGMPQTASIFEAMWNDDEVVPVQQRIKNLASNMAWLFSRNDSERARIGPLVRRLRVNTYYGVDFWARFSTLASIFIAYLELDWDNLRADFRDIHQYLDPRESKLKRYLFSLRYRALGLIRLPSRIWKDFAAAVLKRRRAAEFLHPHRIHLYDKGVRVDGYAHEITHWLQDRKFILHDMPLVSIVEGIADRGRLSTRGSHNPEVPDVWLSPLIAGQPDETFSSLSGQTLESLITARATSTLVDLMIEHEGRNSKIRQEAYEGEGLDDSTDEDDDAAEAGLDLSLWLRQMTDRLKDSTEGYMYFIPTVLYLKSHLLEDRDQWLLQQDEQVDLLKAVYTFSFLISYVSPNEIDSIKEMRTEFPTFSEKTADYIQELVDDWIDKIQTPRFQNFISMAARSEARGKNLWMEANPVIRLKKQYTQEQVETLMAQIISALENLPDLITTKHFMGFNEKVLEMTATLTKGVQMLRSWQWDTWGGELGEAYLLIRNAIPFGTMDMLEKEGQGADVSFAMKRLYFLALGSVLFESETQERLAGKALANLTESHASVDVQLLHHILRLFIYVKTSAEEDLPPSILENRLYAQSHEGIRVVVQTLNEYGLHSALAQYKALEFAIAIAPRSEARATPWKTKQLRFARGEQARDAWDEKLRQLDRKFNRHGTIERVEDLTGEKFIDIFRRSRVLGRVPDIKIDTIRHVFFATSRVKGLLKFMEELDRDAGGILEVLERMERLGESIYLDRRTLKEWLSKLPFSPRIVSAYWDEDADLTLQDKVLMSLKLLGDTPWHLDWLIDIARQSQKTRRSMAHRIQNLRKKYEEAIQWHLMHRLPRYTKALILYHGANKEFFTGKELDVKDPLYATFTYGNALGYVHEDFLWPGEKGSDRGQVLTIKVPLDAVIGFERLDKSTNEFAVREGSYPIISIETITRSEARALEIEISSQHDIIIPKFGDLGRDIQIGLSKLRFKEGPSVPAAAVGKRKFMANIPDDNVVLLGEEDWAVISQMRAADFDRTVQEVRDAQRTAKSKRPGHLLHMMFPKVTEALIVYDISSKDYLKIELIRDDETGNILSLKLSADSAILRGVRQDTAVLHNFDRRSEARSAEDDLTESESEEFVRTVLDLLEGINPKNVSRRSWSGGDESLKVTTSDPMAIEIFFHYHYGAENYAVRIKQGDKEVVIDEADLSTEMALLPYVRLIVDKLHSFDYDERGSSRSEAQTVAEAPVMERTEETADRYSLEVKVLSRSEARIEFKIIQELLRGDKTAEQRLLDIGFVFQKDIATLLNRMGFGRIPTETVYARNRREPLLNEIALLTEVIWELHSNREHTDTPEVILAREIEEKNRRAVEIIYADLGAGIPRDQVRNAVETTYSRFGSDLRGAGLLFSRRAMLSNGRGYLELGTAYYRIRYLPREEEPVNLEPVTKQGFMVRAVRFLPKKESTRSEARGDQILTDEEVERRKEKHPIETYDMEWALNAIAEGIDVLSKLDKRLRHLTATIEEIRQSFEDRSFKRLYEQIRTTMPSRWVVDSGPWTAGWIREAIELIYHLSIGSPLLREESQNRAFLDAKVTILAQGEKLSRSTLKAMIAAFPQKSQVEIDEISPERFNYLAQWNHSITNILDEYGIYDPRMQLGVLKSVLFELDPDARRSEAREDKNAQRKQLEATSYYLLGIIAGAEAKVIVEQVAAKEKYALLNEQLTRIGKQVRKKEQLAAMKKFAGDTQDLMDLQQKMEPFIQVIIDTAARAREIRDELSEAAQEDRGKFHSELQGMAEELNRARENIDRNNEQELKTISNISGWMDRFEELIQGPKSGEGGAKRSEARSDEGDREEIKALKKRMNLYDANAKLAARLQQWNEKYDQITERDQASGMMEQIEESLTGLKDLITNSNKKVEDKWLLRVIEIAQQMKQLKSTYTELKEERGNVANIKRLTEIIEITDIMSPIDGVPLLEQNVAELKQRIKRFKSIVSERESLSRQFARFTQKVDRLANQLKKEMLRSEARSVAEAPVMERTEETVEHIDLTMDPEDMTISSGAIVRTADLWKLGKIEGVAVLKELLTLAQRNEPFTVYVVGQHNLEDHPNRFVRALMKEPKVRRFRRASQVSQEAINKQILIELNLSDQEPIEDKSITEILNAIERKRSSISLQGKAGALTAFLKVAESALQEASEIEDYYEKYILFRIAKFKNGQWMVRQEILDVVRSQLRAAYAVAVAA